MKRSAPISKHCRRLPPRLLRPLPDGAAGGRFGPGRRPTVAVPPRRRSDAFKAPVSSWVGAAAPEKARRPLMVCGHFFGGELRRRNAWRKTPEGGEGFGSSTATFGGYLRGQGALERARELLVFFLECYCSAGKSTEIYRERVRAFGVSPAVRGGVCRRPRRRVVCSELLGGLGGSEEFLSPLCCVLVFWVGFGRSRRWWRRSGEVPSGSGCLRQVSGKGPRGPGVCFRAG